MGTLKSELEKAVPKLAIAAAKRVEKTIPELYKLFCDSFKDVSVTDPQGRAIVFRMENFPYLIKMEYFNRGARKWVAATAGVVLQKLADGKFAESDHRHDVSRARGMHRISEILRAPDSIHENIHPRVTGDFVYVVKVGKDSLKVAFITKNKAGEWVVVTSFYTTEQYLKGCTKQPAVYTK
jgi:hypothetical protein